jgi:protein TonB
MIPHKKHPKKQLENYSKIFLQISLVLVLFIIHVVIENVITEKINAKPPLHDSYDLVIETAPYEFKRYQEPPTKLVQPKPKKIIPTILEKGNPPKVALVDLTPKSKPVLTHNQVTGNSKEEEPKDPPKLEPTIYDVRMVVPLFKGCKDISLEENRKCFEKKMKSFVRNKFDANIASDLGLMPKSYRIFVEFVIDEYGDVTDVNVRAPHSKLKKEVQEMIQKLPEFTPGKMGNKNVKVRYLLPINFKVDE